MEYKERFDYPIIEKGCNGTFLLYKNQWHQLLVCAGRAYNHGLDFKPGRGEIVIENHDGVYDQLIISKMTYAIERINALPYTSHASTWREAKFVAYPTIPNDDLVDALTGEIVFRQGDEPTDESIRACAKLDAIGLYCPTKKAIALLEKMHQLYSWKSETWEI